MIATNQRVPREFIPYILRKGKSTTSKLFIIRYKQNKEQINRYRTIVSKKVEPKAVQRNKIRRQIYEAVRLKEKDQQAKQTTFDIILIPKKQIKESNFQEIKDDILTLFHG